MKCVRRCQRCGKVSAFLDDHHWAGRAGKLKDSAECKIPLCRLCHDWVHRNHRKARAAGLLCPVGCWNDPKRALQAWADRTKV